MAVDVRASSAARRFCLVSAAPICSSSASNPDAAPVWRPGRALPARSGPSPERPAGATAVRLAGVPVGAFEDDRSAPGSAARPARLPPSLGHARARQWREERPFMKDARTPKSRGVLRTHDAGHRPAAEALAEIATRPTLNKTLTRSPGPRDAAGVASRSLQSHPGPGRGPATRKAHPQVRGSGVGKKSARERQGDRRTVSGGEARPLKCRPLILRAPARPPPST
jgi:hypothetical protein